MNSSSINYVLAKVVLLMGMFLCFGRAIAQTADDVELRATSTAAHCIQDGTVSIQVSKKVGSPYEISSISYDLKDKDNNSLAGASGQYVLNNTFSGLKKGTYKAYAKVKFSNNIEVPVGPVSVTVNSDYKIPTVAIKLERKTLKSYKENGVRVPTGIISVMVTGGNRPTYKVVMVEKPTAYTGITEHSLEPDKRIYLYNLPEGTYKFQVSDACGGQEVQTIEMPVVKSDVPQGFVDHAGQSFLTLPFDSAPSATEQTRTNCRWFTYSYSQRSTGAYYTDDQDLAPYLSPTGKALATNAVDITRDMARDTLAKYYNYGWAYGNAKPTRYYAAGEVTFSGTTTGTAADHERMMRVFGRIPDGKKWQEAGYVYMNSGSMVPEVFPAFFLQLKGSSEEMRNGYRGKRAVTQITEFTERAYTPLDICGTRFYVTVKPNPKKTELYCYPISVGLYKADKTTRLGPTSDIQLSNRSQSTNFNNQVLEAGTSYWVKGTDGSGSYIEYEIRLNPDIEYKAVYEKGVDTPDFDICNRRRKSSISISRHTPLLVPFGNHSITLVAAPLEYVPEEDGLAPNETFQFPATFKERVIYPFGKKTENFSVKRKIFAPNGIYKYRIDVCNQSYFTEVIIGELIPKWTVKAENFKPRMTNVTCGRIRVYPFTAANKDNLLFKNGIAAPGEVFLSFSEFPQGLSVRDITHNMVAGSTWAWTYHSSLYMIAAPSGKPEDLYFELPKTNGTMKVKISLLAKEYDRVFKELDCFPEYTLDLSNVPLSYERESYIGYSCPGGLSGHLFIVPTNNVGGVKIELFKEGDSNPFATKTLQKEQVKNGASFDLTGTIAAPIPGKIRAKLTDLQCNNYNDESLIIYNLPSPDMIRTGDQQRKFCEGDKIELAVINLGKDVTFTWKLPNGQTLTGQKITLNNVDYTYSGEYEVTINNILCGGAPSAISQKFVLSVAPRELWWRKDAKDANWHNLDNWAKRDGTPIKAVPAPCTTVHIPAVVDKAFPDLAGDITKRDVYGKPECDSIFFHYGAQLGTPQQLTYTNAHVDYNFGINTAGTISAHAAVGHPTADSKLMKRNRWYMIAAPLKYMLSGDFGVGGEPKTYQRYLKVSTTAPLVDASFTKPFNSQIEPLSTYNNAMALRVADYRFGVTGYAEQSTLNDLGGIIRLPFFLSSRSVHYRHHQFNARTMESTFRYYKENTLDLTNRTDVYRRSPSAFRFVFEQATNKIGNILISGTNTEGYSLATQPTMGGIGDWIMLGNPFMAPIDFDKFYEVNNSRIEPYYYLFSENGWKVYTRETAPVSTLSKEIAPLQSVVVRRKATGSGELLFPTSGPNSVLLPAWRTGQTLHEVKNQSVTTLTDMPLTINVTNTDGRYSQAFLGWSSSVSVPVLANAEYSSLPTVFLVDPDEGVYNAISYPKRAYGMIDLGVASSLSAPLSLSFEHIDRSLYEELTLIDKHEGVEQDLLSNACYKFVHRPEVASSTRFALRLKRYGITNISGRDAMSVVDLKLYEVAGKLRVESADAIHKVVLYNMQGQRLLDAVTNDNETYLLDLDKNSSRGVVIMEVFYKNGMRVVQKYDLK